MKSWDLFDTLVACRPLAPAGDHLSELYPIAEMVAQVQPGDVVVSDYYNAKGAEAALRLVAGLPNKLVVTDSDKYNGTIWPRLGAIELHTGDNPVADYAKPRENGIPARLVSVSQPTEIEFQIRAFGSEGLALACREARLATWREEFRALQLLQVQANFPLLVLAAIALHNFAEERKLTRLLMSARDCCLWTGLQRQICERLNGGYSVEYVPSSRICRNAPSSEYMGMLNACLQSFNCALVDIGGTGKSLARLAARSAQPDVPIFLLTQYNWTNADGFGPIDLSNVTALLQESDNVLESVNVATHGIYVDWWERVDHLFDWQREEIQVMHNAFEVALFALRHQPLPVYNADLLRLLFGKARELTACNLDFLRPGIIAEERLREQYERNACAR